MKLYLLAALTLALIGCASSGPKFDAPRLTEVRNGETTIADMITRYGRPSVLSKNMDGTQTAAYMYVAGRSDAGSFVSLMGALAGNADANVDSAIFYFDSKGVLSGYKTTQAKAKAPELAQAEQATPSSAPTAANRPTQAADKPPRTERKASAPDSNPWTIQLYPSGYRENR